MKNFINEFRFDVWGTKAPNNPANPRIVLAVDAQGNENVNGEQYYQYYSITGITNHMVMWSRSDV